MNNYETIFLVKENTTEEQRENIAKNIKEFLYENGKVMKEESLGLKTLAYEIRKCKKAFYFIIEFEAELTTVQKLEKIYKKTDDIIKFITIKRED